MVAMYLQPLPSKRARLGLRQRYGPVLESYHNSCDPAPHRGYAPWPRVRGDLRPPELRLGCLFHRPNLAAARHDY